MKSIIKKKVSIVLRNHINYYMNGGVILHKCNLEFLQKLNIVDFDSAKIYREEDINPLLARNRILYHVGFRDVSIADIVGSNICDKNCRNIIQMLDQLFDDGGDDYHTRSVGLLKLDKDTIISQLSRSFKKEPICVTEIDDNKYVISINGMHRFAVLRLMYLSELSLVKTEEERAFLKRKYTIPVDTCVVDTSVSYVMNLISAFDINGQIKDIFNEYDNNYRPTGNLVIVLSNCKKIKYTRDEFLNYMKNIDANIDYPDVYKNIDINIAHDLIKSYETISSFKSFVSKYCPRFLQFIIEKNQAKARLVIDLNLYDFEKSSKKGIKF